MKIGIVCSGYDMFSLMKVLNQYDHEYVFVYDHLYWPYGEKPFDWITGRVLGHVSYLENLGVDKIILPPLCELAIEHQSIIPLFKNYLMNACFKHSLVGKVGLWGDFADVQVAQRMLEEIAKKYELTDNQKGIKKFHKPFAYWIKETPMWKYYLTSFSYSDYMVNKQVKFDLKYFKDASVDTVIPLNYGYFSLERPIKKFFNAKKTRFHGLDILLDGYDFAQGQSKYAVCVHYTGQKETLAHDKRLMWLLQKGKSVELDWKAI